MATIESLSRRHLDIVKLYEDSKDLIITIQLEAIKELIPLLQVELNLEQDGLDKVKEFLNDRVTVFRFSRRAKFIIPHSLTLLHATLKYRLTTSLSSPHPIITLSSPLYLSLPLFYFHPSLIDKFGRPCGVLNLALVGRSEDGSLEELKEFTRVAWEMGRRWLSDLSNTKSKGKGKEIEETGEVKVQMVVIVDLLGAGMSNLEFELLPFFMDLLKNHFPGMVGAIFVLNYGWMYAGMWQVARRVLPNTALERILFPNKAELLEFFDEEHLLVEHGGTLSYEYSSSNPILSKYGGSPSVLPPSSTYPSPSPSPIHSRTHSTDSLEDVYTQAGSGRSSSSNLSNLSSEVGPGTISRRTSGLSMTTLKSSRSGLKMSERLAGWKSPGESGGSLLKRVTSFAELQERLMETQKAIESDSGSEDESDEIVIGNGNITLTKDLNLEREIKAKEYARQVGESLEGGTSGTEDDDDEEEISAMDPDADDEDVTPTEGDSSTDTTPRSSRFSSRVGSRDISTVNSRETSPSGALSINTGKRKGDGETFSTRAVRFSGTNQMSPYNVSNPYYGYPAFVTSTLSDSSGVSHPHFQRRRKRDLVRTLTYLAVLRFLALNRHIKWRISKIVATILRLGLIRTGNEDIKKTRVRWEESVDTKKIQVQGQKERVKVDIRVVYILVALLLLKSSLGSKLSSILTKKILSFRIIEGVKNVLVNVSSSSNLSGTVGGTLRKRDYVKGLLGLSSKV